jgi:hypothetical protein
LRAVIASWMTTAHGTVRTRVIGNMGGSVPDPPDRYADSARR